MNVPNLEKYKRMVGEGLKPIMTYRPAPPGHRLLDAVSSEIIRGRLGPDVLKGLPEKAAGPAEELLNQWEEGGLLKRENGSYDLTRAGLFWRANMEWALRSLISGELMKGASA